MDKRWVAVYTTVTLSLLALANSSNARTPWKTSPRKPPATAAASPASANARSIAARPAVRSTRNCPLCDAGVAKKSKRRSISKSAMAAKSLPCHPKDYVDPKIARNYRAALRDMKRAQIKPQITSVWRSSENQAQLRKCSLSTRCRRANPGLYYALPPGKSLHEAGFAVDISGVAVGPRGDKQLTPRGRRIVGIMRKNGFKWRYGLKDPAHFEADPKVYGYRSTQQAIRKTQTTCQFGLAKNKSHKKAGARVAAGRAHAPARVYVSSEASVPRPRRHVSKTRA